MSLTGTLLAGVSGLKAQTNAMAVISDNIANLNTIGYKKSDATFSTLVVNSAASTTYSPGGVVSGRFALIDNQGTLQASNRPLDVAITGNGFFAVNDSSTGSGNNLYTRAGSFTEDAQGHLVNTNGMYLMGWSLDQTGSISNVNQLSLVSVGTLNGVAVDSQNVSVGANFDSSQTVNLSTASVTGPVIAGLTSTDDLTTAPASLASGDSLDFTIAGVTNTYQVGAALSTTTRTFNTLADLQTLLQIDYPGATFAINNATSAATMTVTSAFDFTIADNTNTPATTLFGAASVSNPAGNYDAGDMQDGTVSPDFSRQIQIFDALGTAHDVTLAVSRAGTNTWAYELYTSLPNATYTQTGSDSEISGSATGRGLLSAGQIVFNGDGSLNAINNFPTTLPSGNTNQAIYTSGSPAALTINWANGANSSSTTFDFGTPGAVGTGLTDGLSQFASNYNVAFINQDGSAVGLRTGITIDKDGFVIASFSNGATQKIFQVPITTFANPNALQAQNGNTFSQTNGSGSFNWRIAGTGGAGIVAPSSLESSNADLGDEFSNMIVTQRAYSANAKTITTADQMMQELLQVIR